MPDGSKEYEEGKAAKAKGLTDAANVYEAGSQQSADWLAGYVADEEAARDGTSVPGPDAS